MPSSGYTTAFQAGWAPHLPSKPQGRVAIPNRMNFRKNSKQPSSPPLILGKLYRNFFVMDMDAQLQGGMRAR